MKHRYDHSQLEKIMVKNVPLYTIRYDTIRYGRRVYSSV